MATDKIITAGDEEKPVEMATSTELQSTSAELQTTSTELQSTSAESEPTSAEPESTSGAEKQNEKTREEKLLESQNLLATGKRHLLCGEVHNAIESLQTSCQILSEQYGETADEVGEAYFFYGKARLELSRMESGVLGNALTGVPEDGDTEEEEDQPESTTEGCQKPVVEKIDESSMKEDEREEIAAQVYDAMAEKEGETEKQDDEKMEKESEKSAEEKMEEEKSVVETKEGNKDEENIEKGKKDEVEEEEKMEDDEAEAEGEEEEGDDTAEDVEGADEETNEVSEEKEEDDISNIQLAWETLDLARVIFSRHDSREMQLKAAQAHLKLGEVSLELEQYDQALKDFHACLTIQKTHLEADDRLLAETCYQLGVAYSYNREYGLAREHLNEALKTVDDRKAKLEKEIGDCGDDKEKESVKKAAEEELKELAEIVPDIEAKIKDTEDEEKEIKEMAKNEAMKIFEAASAGASTSGFGEASSSAEAEPKKVNILVPRKRKPEDELCEEDKTKKQRQEEKGGFGDATAENVGAEAVATDSAETMADAEAETTADAEAETIADAAVETTAAESDVSNGGAETGANGDAEVATNGDAKTGAEGDSEAVANGDHPIGNHDDKSEENGCGDKGEIKTKTVEDVLKEKASADAAMDTA